jgi:hypothetical protein
MLIEFNNFSNNYELSPIYEYRLDDNTTVLSMNVRGLFQTQKRGQMYLIGPKVNMHPLCVFRKHTVIII